MDIFLIIHELLNLLLAVVGCLCDLQRVKKTLWKYNIVIVVIPHCTTRLYYKLIIGKENSNKSWIHE